MPTLTVLYACLGISLLLSYFIPFSMLTSLTLFNRAVVGGFVTALPVLFSSIIFAKMFKETQFADAGLGSNILGGLLGGGIEALSIFVGIRSMALVAIFIRSEEHTSELQSHSDLVCRLLLEKKKSK